jgi:photosystem II stability/assembly factor-like uncharacterized protein
MNKLAFGILVVLISFAFNVQSQAVWKQYNGPFAGAVNSFATYDGKIYAGSRLTGVFISDDAGASWTPTIPELRFVHCVFSADTSLLIGTDKLFSYKSSRGTAIQLGQQITGVIEHMQIVDGHLFVSTDYGVYFYNAAENKLELKVNGLPDDQNPIYWTRDLVHIGNSLFCIVWGKGIYKSDDFGENWKEVKVDGITFLAEHNNRLYCGGSNGLFESIDGGATWQDIMFNLEPSYFSPRTIAGMNNDIIFSSTKGTYIKRDGNYWTNVNARMFTAMDYNGTEFLASDEGGVFRFDTETTQFSVSNYGINTSRVNDVEIFDGKVYSATEQSVHLTGTDRDEWSVVPELEEMYSMAIEKKGDHLFAGTSMGLYVNNKGETNWTIVSGISKVPIWDIEVANDKIYVASDDGLYVSHNDGASWRLFSNTVSPINQFTHVGISESALICGNNLGLYKILPDSSDWEKVSFFEAQGIVSVNVIENNLYVTATNTPVYKSTDSGETWHLCGFPSLNRVEMIKRGDNIYASDFSRVYYSSDNGDSWDYWSETGVPDIILTCIAEGENAFYMGTYGNSIWRRPFLSSHDIDSDLYYVSGDSIYNVDENTTAEIFRENVEVSHGASISIEGENSGGRTNGALLPGSAITVIAEDQKNQQTYYVARNKMVTGLPESLNNELTLYPVPATDILYIRNAGTVQSCVVRNMQGLEISRPSMGKDGLDISALPSGLYLLQIRRDGKAIETARFIKN